MRETTRAALLTIGLAACGGSGGGGGGGTPPTLSVEIAPRYPNAQTSATVQFAASVKGSADVAVLWSAPDCGRVSQEGLFTAPDTAGTCRVLAASHADPSKIAQATVTVTTSAASAWRPFSDESPWNQPIPANPPLEDDSAELVARFIASSPWKHLGVNIDGYSVPLFWAEAGTPTASMTVRYGGQGWQGPDTTAAMPMPAGAAPDPQPDHHMLVISADRRTEYGCWDVSHSGSTWEAGVCATSDLTGTGVRPAAGQPGVQWWQAAGARACGFPLVAGLIRVEEIQAGRIDHALVLAYPGIRNGGFTPPASTPSNGSGAAVGVPCGGRFQYDPGVDLSTLGLSRSGLIIMRALQEYGAYIGDYSGSLSLYAENSPAAVACWSGGVLDDVELVNGQNQSRIDLTKFRVLKLGTVHDVH
jgi:hypothetical protein